MKRNGHVTLLVQRLVLTKATRSVRKRTVRKKSESYNHCKIMPVLNKSTSVFYRPSSLSRLVLSWAFSVWAFFPMTRMYFITEGNFHLKVFLRNKLGFTIIAH